MQKKSILVSTVNPGGTRTSFHKEERPDYLGPEDVARLIYFIASRSDNVLISGPFIVSDKDERIP